VKSGIVESLTNSSGAKMPLITESPNPSRAPSGGGARDGRLFAGNTPSVVPSSVVSAKPSPVIVK